MLCPPTHGTRRAVYRRLYHILINFSCTESLGSGITSAGVAALAESNFAQIDGFDDSVELHGVAAGELLPSIAAVVR